MGGENSSDSLLSIGCYGIQFCLVMPSKLDVLKDGSAARLTAASFFSVSDYAKY